MVWTKGKSGNPGGRGVHKPFADMLRMELAAAGSDQKALREIARNLIAIAKKPGEQALPAIVAIADRLDGKPAQETNVTVEKRDAADWSFSELVASLRDEDNAQERTPASSGRPTELN